MKIRYKLVSMQRKSCIVPDGSMYCLTYRKGTIVKALPGTFGIMVFSTKERANQYKNGYLVLKVRPIGRIKKVQKFSDFSRIDALTTTNLFKKFYKIYHLKKYHKHWWGHVFKFIEVPKGTECYSSVEVLE